MRQIIVKLGRIQTVIAITALSSLASVLITLFLISGFSQIGINLDVFSHIMIALLVPLLLAPPISWEIIGLLLKVDQLEVEMRKAATFDALTGLFNRQAFLEQAHYVFHLAAREAFGFSVLVVDLDHFKSINDQFGHAHGDRVLETYGRIASHVARRSDLAGRLGGEEFAFLLPNTSAEQAWNFSERLHETIRNTVIEHDGDAIHFTISIGIATVTREELNSKDLEKVLSLADQAMYQAKQQGRNQSVIFANSYAVEILVAS